MATKEETIEKHGTVLDALPNAEFRVQLDDSQHIIKAHISGRIRKHYIRILKGDKVDVVMSAYNINVGRIVFRKR